MGTEATGTPTAVPPGFGRAPLAVTAGLAVLCAFGLVGGGVGIVANALAPAASPSEIHAGAPEPGAGPGSGAGTETDGGDEGTGDGTAPGPDGPSAPPERGSAPAAEEQASDWVYVIRWGDTLSQISLDTGVSVERLAEYNAILDIDLIYADAVLRIPYLLIPGQENTPAAGK